MTCPEWSKVPNIKGVKIRGTISSCGGYTPTSFSWRAEWLPYLTGYVINEVMQDG